MAARFRPVDLARILADVRDPKPPFPRRLTSIPAERPTSPLPAKCDGDHAAPACSDRQCWHGNQLVFAFWR